MVKKWKVPDYNKIDNQIKDNSTLRIKATSHFDTYSTSSDYNPILQWLVHSSR